MKKLLFIISLCFVGVLAIWLSFVVPHLKRLPGDFSYSSDIVSVDNFYNEKAGGYRGEQYSLTKFGYDVTSVLPEGYTVQNIFNVRTPEGDPIISLKRFYGIDPDSRSHVAFLGDQSREGYLFAPLGLKEGQPFRYWHINYDAPAEMEYVGTETLYGLKVFHYKTSYTNQIIDQTKNLTNLPDVGVTRGIVLEPILELWVEPTTGWLVKYTDNTTAYYYDLATKEKIAPWNHFKNSYTEYSVKKQVLEARQQKEFFNLINIIIPLIILGVLFFILGIYVWGEALSELLRKKNLFTFFALLSVVGFSLALSLVFWILFQKNVNEEGVIRFENKTEQITAFIQNRINLYEGVVFGLQGLFAASEKVEEREWRAYLEKINIPRNFSGVSSVSYIARVSKSKASSYPYDIYPKADKDEYYPLTYSVFFLSATTIPFGFDFSSEQKRNHTLMLAQERGEPVATPLVISVVAKVPIFSIYAPVYETSLYSTTETKVEKKLQGFVSVGFRVRELFEGFRSDPVFDPAIDIEIYDTPDIAEISPDNLVFDSNTAHDISQSDSAFMRVTNVVVAGRIWTVYFVALPSYVADSNRQTSTVVLVSGFAVSILLGVCVFSLVVSRKNALNLVSVMTRDLEKNKEQLEIKLHETEKLNKFMVDREVKMIDLKQKIKELESGQL